MRLPRMRNVMAWTLVLLLMIAVALLGVRIAGLSSLPDLQPVSYTHLDVYKRQALGYLM